MKPRELILAGVVAVAMAAGLALAQPAPPSSSQTGVVTPGATRPPGYLTEASAPDAAVILPPAPVAGTSRYEQDRAIYRATQAMAGTPRYALAAADNDASIPAMFADFSCALGATPTPQTAPRLTLLFARVSRDTGMGMNHAKRVFQRRRPYQIDAGPICIAHTPSLDGSPDYPSGHVTWGWSLGLLLAELAPDRATQILTRARAFGESRAVCGVHNASAIEAGRTTGAAVVAAEHGVAEFRTDLEAARRELAALRTAGPAPAAAACRTEASLVERTPYPY